MKLGLGLYRHMLNRDNYRFAKQAGATHIVAHLADYFRPGNMSTASGDQVWGQATGSAHWTYDELRALRQDINDEGLELAALENFDPATGTMSCSTDPGKQEQLESIKTTIRNMGAPHSLHGLLFQHSRRLGPDGNPFRQGQCHWGWLPGEPDAAANADSQWHGLNMLVDEAAPPGYLPDVTHEQIWGRLEDFLTSIVPVAEEAGVRLAAHPDDPPLPVLRGMARLVTQPQHYQRLLDLVPSHNNSLEMCLGNDF